VSIQSTNCCYAARHWLALVTTLQAVFKVFALHPFLLENRLCLQPQRPLHCRMERPRRQRLLRSPHRPHRPMLLRQV